MAPTRVIVVGAGPAGVRAAEALVQAGLRPAVVDEARNSGGQIYRRAVAATSRSYRSVYGFDAARARALHDAFAALLPAIDYRPETLAWNVRDGWLHVVRDRVAESLPFDALILATGATDRLLPVPGWTLPGCYSLGGAQIALKAHACSIGRRVAFLGTGPLLYLVAHQYASAGVQVATVLDTAPFRAQLAALPRLMARPTFVARGLYFRARLQLMGVSIATGVAPERILGEEAVTGVRYRDASSRIHEAKADAVALGFHLRPETQLADLAGCSFAFDETVGQWVPERDADGRTTRMGVYVAGDGIRVLGADAAECAGRLAALAALADRGLPADADEIARLRRRLARFERFRSGLAVAFPWPARLAREAADDVVVCRCEVITAGQLREAAAAKDAPELNRAKAFSRLGMGRCQGRYCGHAGAEILAAARDASLESVGRLRGQAPVKPLSVATRTKEPAA